MRSRQRFSADESYQPRPSASRPFATRPVFCRRARKMRSRIAARQIKQSRSSVPLPFEKVLPPHIGQRSSAVLYSFSTRSGMGDYSLFFIRSESGERSAEEQAKCHARVPQKCCPESFNL